MIVCVGKSVTTWVPPSQDTGVTSARILKQLLMADTKHGGRFRLRASVMTIPADEPIEGMQLGHVNVAVFREGDVR